MTMPDRSLPTSLIPDMAWCWWTRPRATRLGDAVFFAALDSEGGMVVARHDLDARTTERARLAAFEDDDHNNPALVAQPGKPLLCFYSRHDAEEGLRYRISRRPLDLGAWEPEQILTFGGSTTYAQVHEVGGELHLFTRVDETRWGWRLSRDWARTWEAPRDFLSFDTDQQVYMATALLGDGRTMRVGVSGHPKDYEKKPLHDVWACEVDLVTGEVRKPSTGGIIGNLRTGDRLPLRETALELVQRTPVDRTVNVLDVSSGPVFEIGFVSKVRNDLTTEDARYHVAALRDGRWSTEDVAPAGRKFGYIDAGLYVGGVAFPERAAAGQVYLTREAGGLWHFEFWRRADDGSWSGEPVLPPGPIRMTRPWAVYPPDERLGVVALALERYADDSYLGSLSHLIGAPLPKDFIS
jgi:hypothetical protein